MRELSFLNRTLEFLATIRILSVDYSFRYECRKLQLLRIQSDQNTIYKNTVISPVEIRRAPKESLGLNLGYVTLFVEDQ